MYLPKSLTTIPPLSKILAGVLFITLPFLGFYLGMGYEKKVTPDFTESPTPVVRTTPKPTADPTANWKTYKNEKYGFEFKYPDHLIEPEEEDGKIILKHSIPLEHPDPCDAKGTGLIKKGIEDLKAVFEVINKNLIETVIGNSGDYLQENYIKDNKIKLESGFIDESNYGLLKGYRVTEGVEGCGNYTFYFPMSAQKTLLIKRQFVPELNPIIVNYKENLKIPGIILPKTEEQLFNQILSTFKFLDLKQTTPTPTSKEVSKLVIVTVKIDPPWQAEGNLTPERQKEQRAAVVAAINQVLTGLDAGKVYARLEGLPLISITADKQTLEYLSSHPLVSSIQEDELSSPTN